MRKIKRRSMLKSLGGVSLGGLIPFQPSPGSHGQFLDGTVTETETDVLVVGGGTAGVIAALQAARAGCSTVIVENGSQLGGTITTGGVSFPGLFYAWGKQVVGGIGWELVQDVVKLNDDQMPDFSVPYGTQHPLHQVRINGFLYALLAEEKCLAAGIRLRYYETPLNVQALKEGWEVETVGKGIHNRIRCKQLIDCTGNAFVCSLAGFKLLQEEETQPGTIIFLLEGYDIDSLDKKRIEELYRHALDNGELKPGDASTGILHMLGQKGDNAQHTFGADSTTSETHTATNIAGRESLLRMLRFVRTLPGCETTRLVSMQPETAVRETYRIDGEYQITLQDYIGGRVFEDALSYSFYPIDLHDENGVRPDHLQEGIVATVPLRSLVPRSSRNFLVAGRCVSSDRLANSALRVQCSCMGMGQAAGAAAALACKLNSSPTSVPLEEIRQLITKHGGIVPTK